MRIAVNGAELFFDVYGSSLAPKGSELVDKPVIVALHGGLASLGFSFARPCKQLDRDRVESPARRRTGRR